MPKREEGGVCNWGVSRKFHTPWATLTRVPAGLCLTCTARCCVAEVGAGVAEGFEAGVGVGVGVGVAELPVLLSMPGRWLRVRYLISGRKLRGNVATTSTNISSRQATYRTYIFISRGWRGRRGVGQNTTL